MKIEKRALYNLMRMNWLMNPSIVAEPWQVEDYRTLPIEKIFDRLKAHEIRLDKSSFLAFAAEVDTPEELNDFLLDDTEADVVTQDQVYLLVFELWRRLITDRPSLSIFCDELDYQIHEYDATDGANSEHMQDVIGNLQEILDENSDQGGAPADIFKSICSDCANDVENFLYDYISDHLAAGHDLYVSELLDGLTPYISDVKWFGLLRAQLLASQDSSSSQDLAQQLIEYYGNGGDVEFNLELLTFIVHGGDQASFVSLVKKTLPLLTIEDEFQSLLGICMDFYRRSDKEKKEKEIEKMLTRRSHLHLEGDLKPKDPQYAELLALLVE